MEKKDDNTTVAIHREDTNNDLEKPGAVKRDYSGAVTEIDPVERKLVRKLDIRIMVNLSWYFQDNSLLTLSTANTMADVLAQLS